MPVRAGWVPCVGFQPPKPMVLFIEEADAIAEECERAFQQVSPSSKVPAVPRVACESTPVFVPLHVSPLAPWLPGL